MTAEAKDRAARRAEEHARRDRDRRTRRLALRNVAELAAQDPTTSGFTLIMPDGTVEYLDAGALRRGGHA
jgi:hypothetical protein